jgi:hypothetical protein
MSLFHCSGTGGRASHLLPYGTLGQRQSQERDELVANLTRYRHATPDATAPPSLDELSDEELRERRSASSSPNLRLVRRQRLFFCFFSPRSVVQNLGLNRRDPHTSPTALAEATS